MGDDLVMRLREGVWGRARRADAVIHAAMQDGADLIEAQAAEIIRLRAELATARREGVEEAASEAQARADFWVSGTNKEAKIRHDEARKIAAAIRAAAKEGKA